MVLEFQPRGIYLKKFFPSFVILFSLVCISCEFYDNLYRPHENGTTTQEEQVDLTASYTVRHLVQSINKNGYSPVATEFITAKAGELTQAVAKEYEGFTAQPFNQQVIAFTCTTVIEIKYDRNSYTYNFDLNGGEGIETSATGVYEEPLIIGSPKRLGYVFYGWDTENKKLPSTFIENNTFKALWAPASGTAYTVNHYQEKIDSSDYEYFESEYCYGKTNDLTNAVQKTYAGFTSQSFNQQNIEYDGSTIINIYYNRKTFKVSFDFDYLDEEGKPIIQEYAYKSGQKTAAPIPEREGYLFLGWVPEVMSRVTADSTHTAKWTSTKLVPIQKTDSLFKLIHANTGLDYTFTATEGFDLYEWSVNNEKQSETSNTFHHDFTGEPENVYMVTVYAKKNSVIYSDSITVKVVE